MSSVTPGASLRVRTKFFLPSPALEKWGAGRRCLGAVPTKQGNAVGLGPSSQRRPTTSVGSCCQTAGFLAQTPQCSCSPLTALLTEQGSNSTVLVLGSPAAAASNLFSSLATATTELQARCQVQLLDLIPTSDHTWGRCQDPPVTEQEAEATRSC